MNLDDFKTWSLNQGQLCKYDTGEFCGQCVSLINQYCYRVLGVPAGSWGNAKDWPSNPNVQQYFDSVSSPQAGDIGVLGSNYGGGYGHIYIFLGGGQILEQNGNLPLKIGTRSPYSNPIAILRHKGAPPPEEQDMTDPNFINNVYTGVLMRTEQPYDPVTNTWRDTGAENWLGMPKDVCLQLILESPERAAVEKNYRDGTTNPVPPLTAQEVKDYVNQHLN